jgi:hypothetical protein
MMIRRETARRMAGWMGGLSLLAAAAWSLPAHATVDVNQVWTAVWKRDQQSDDSWADTGKIDGFGNGDGTTISVNPQLTGATISGTSTLSFDATQGKLRSHSKFDVEMDGIMGWGELFFASVNNTRINDQLTVAADGFGFAKILILISGSSTYNGSITSAPLAYAPTRLSGGVTISASVTGTDSVNQSARFNGKQDFEYSGGPNGTFNVDGTLVSNEVIEFIVPWDDNIPFQFDMTYIESFQFTNDGLDADKVKASGENNFGHTVGLFADVYDANGNLLPGVRVQSASGINFQNLVPVVATVPEPSSLALVGLAGLAWLGRRRRH